MRIKFIKINRRDTELDSQHYNSWQCVAASLTNIIINCGMRVILATTTILCKCNLFGQTFLDPLNRGRVYHNKSQDGQASQLTGKPRLLAVVNLKNYIWWVDK